MIFITPNSEAFLKSGLAKSAFRQEIYRGLPLDYYLPGIDATSRLTRLEGVMAKFYQSHDLFLAFYQPFDLVYESLKQSNKAAPAWRSFVEHMVKSANYIELNNIASGSMELAAAAAARALTLILNTRVRVGQQSFDLETLNQVMKSIEQNNPPQELIQDVQAAGGAAQYLKLMEKWISDAGRAAAGQLSLIIREIQEYIDAKREAEAAAAVLAGGGHGYSLEGLSVWSFFEKPDEFRRRVRLLAAAVQALRLFSRILPASFVHTSAESLWGGVDGTAKMLSYAQIPKILPSELATMNMSPLLFAVKVAQMALHVYRHAAAIKPVVFLDKSGSMAESLEGGPEGVPKISLAAGLALALYKFGLVYLFDTEIEEVNPRDVVRVLLTIKADGGTAIDVVLEEILRLGRRDYIYIIISDGITEASHEVLRRFETSGLAKQTKLIILPPSGEGYNWVEVLRRHGRVVRATDVAGFVAAARQALT
jgi:uncharacterized protein with von Willebrand factor type A (vWA) domain